MLMNRLAGYANRTALAVFYILFITLLSSCGGGGGGNSNVGGISFSLNRSSLAFDYFDDEVPASQAVVATGQGAYQGTLYVVVDANSAHVGVSASISNTSITFFVVPKAGLSAGTYSGTIVLHACTDSACSREVGNSPLSVSYTIRVKPGIHVLPNNGDFTAVSGSEVSRDYTVQLPGNATLTATTLSVGASYFDFAVTGPNSFRVTGKKLPSGHYYGTVHIETSSRAIDFGLQYDVTAPPGGEHSLLVTQNNLTMVAAEGALSSTSFVYIQPATWDPSYTVKAEHAYGTGEWIRTRTVADGIEVVADATNLAAGRYLGDIVIEGPEYQSKSYVITVALTVGPGLVRPADAIVDVNPETTASQLTDTRAINLAGGTTNVGWTATSDQSWLRVTASGITGGNLTYSIDQAAFAALSNRAVHTATVTIIPAIGTISPTSFQVQLHKNLAQVTGLGPSLTLANQSSQLYVRGVGFDSIANIGARLSIFGITPAGITRVNDTEILVSMPAAPAGSYPVSVSNALGVTTASRSLNVIAPRNLSHAESATGGSPSAVIYDAKRNVAYVANPALNSVQRFSPSGTQWIVDSMQIPMLSNIAFSNDLGSIYALSTDGTLWQLGLDGGFTQRNSFYFGRPNASNDRGTAMPVTNDGRIWLGPGSADRFGLAYFDHVSGTFSTIPAPLFSNIRGPSFAIGRDGERLYVNQNDCCSSDSVLYLDAAEGMLHESLAGLKNFRSGRMSDTGNRLHSGYSVYDKNLMQVGDITQSLVPNTLFVASEISPDGNRLYVLGYPNSQLPSSQFSSYDPVPTEYPHVYVFDTSVQPQSGASFPLLGYFTLAQYPTCRAYWLCTQRPASTISPDGRTLFFAGSDYFMVVPIPDASGFLQSVASPKTTVVTKSPLRWDLRIN